MNAYADRLREIAGKYKIEYHALCAAANEIERLYAERDEAMRQAEVHLKSYREEKQEKERYKVERDEAIRQLEEKIVEVARTIKNA